MTVMKVKVGLQTLLKSKTKAHFVMIDLSILDNMCYKEMATFSGSHYCFAF